MDTPVLATAMRTVKRMSPYNRQTGVGYTSIGPGKAVVGWSSGEIPLGRKHKSLRTDLR